MNILEIKNVSYSYSSSNEEVLSLVNRGFEQGK
ncbi:MAG: ABC transporter ATP-binding protein, partial [Finegoldia magna]|nr:ABC transporter ATP-binding protein [Finegoldia magna]